ncbi:GTPase IMAP family member 7-like [Eucyclogobius newberryi]|uniref:GTPase IMAP family member 7-like n=1 Tax=Eucyclogobius newberryi TaxID=166745 RepID=UPI003B590A10
MGKQPLYSREQTKGRRIVLLGKTGSAKSSLANTIMGEEDWFKVSPLPNSETKNCHSKMKLMNGKYIKLIDTPGVFDTDPKSSDFSPEILKCMKECSPGAHAFLLVLKVEKFTQQEQAVVDLILKYFSKEALSYTTVVFTHGDDLQSMKIRDWVNQNEALRSLVQRCEGRCHVFDNKHWKNQVQVTELLRTIEETVEKNRGRCYTNEVLQNVKSYKWVCVPVGFVLGVFLGGFVVSSGPVGIGLGALMGAAAGASLPSVENYVEDLFKQFKKTGASTADGSLCRFL